MVHRSNGLTAPDIRPYSLPRIRVESVHDPEDDHLSFGDVNH
jgi:hypothetical protein